MFVECLTLGTTVFAECLAVPSVRHSVNNLFTERRTLPRAALGKVGFAECPIKSTRQSLRHSAKGRIPVVPHSLCADDGGGRRRWTTRMDDVDVGKPRLPWKAAGDGDGVGRRRSAAVVGRPGGGCGRGRGGGGQHGGAWSGRTGGVRAAGVGAACGRRGGGRQLQRGGGQHWRRAGGRGARAGQHGGAGIEIARA
jgi:hypothetical protein